MAAEVVSLTGARLAFGDRVLWDHLDLTVSAGEFIAILGPNGTGKTSLLRVLLGQLPLSAGTATIEGQPIEAGSERIGYAGENGKPYTAIGRVLIAEGALARENVSLASIRAWLKHNPVRAQAVMEADQSFIFFEEKPVGDAALGNQGTLGAALVLAGLVLAAWRLWGSVKGDPARLAGAAALAASAALMLLCGGFWDSLRLFFLTAFLVAGIHEACR